MQNSTATLTTLSVSDVRRGDVIVDGAGAEWTVRKVSCPMDDMRGVHFTFEQGGTFRYLTDDKVQVVA